MMEPSLETLLAENEIRKLALRYAYGVDSRDWDLMNSLWVERKDPLPESTMLDGGFMSTMPEVFANCGTSTMLVANHLIDVESPTRATGKVYCHCWVEWDQFFEQTLIYHDIYEKHDGKWLFLTRNHLLWWGREWKDNPMTQAPANWPDSQIGAGVASERIRVGG